MITENDSETRSEDKEKYYAPGEILLYKKAPVETLAEKETLDEGEIDDVQPLKDQEHDETNHPSFVDDKFIEINKEKGDIVFLSVTNLGLQSIKVNRTRKTGWNL